EKVFNFCVYSHICQPLRWTGSPAIAQVAVQDARIYTTCLSGSGAVRLIYFVFYLCALPLLVILPQKPP
ncbi:MAG TPA: hypothetical protein V6D25_23675, partial [Leptolyngbyaceae cyanobacterium]